MCLGIPGQVIAFEPETPLRMATVDFGGVRRKVSLAYVPEAEVGAWCLVHVGFALSVLDEAEALRSLAAIREYLAEELGPEPRPPGGAPVEGPRLERATATDGEAGGAS